MRFQMCPQSSCIKGCIITLYTCIFISLALIFLPGKQGSSATFFDPWTNAKLDHIRNHKKDEEHTPQTCKDITFIDLKSMDKNFTHHAMESGGSRQTGKHFGSVTGANLVPLEDIFRYKPPLMHIIMGLGNTVFNELKKVVIELDGEVERNVEQSERLKDMYKKKEELDIIFSNYNLDKMILINDSERVEAFLKGDKKKAEKVALANYEPFHSKKKKKDCGAEMCILFPVDEKTDMLISSNV